MSNCSVALQVLPTVPEEKLFYVVDKVIEYIAEQGVKYVVGPFETTMEGELDELMEIVKEAQRIACEYGADGLYSYVKIAYNPNGVYTIEEKTDKYQNIRV